MNIREHLEAAQSAAREQGNTELVELIQSALIHLDTGAQANASSGGGGGGDPDKGG